MNRVVSWLALGFSLVALFLSATLYFQTDARAEAALRRREKAFAVRHAAQVRQMCKDLGVAELPAKTPETFDELVEPLLEVLGPTAR